MHTHHNSLPFLTFLKCIRWKNEEYGHDATPNALDGLEWELSLLVRLGRMLSGRGDRRIGIARSSSDRLKKSSSASYGDEDALI